MVGRDDVFIKGYNKGYLDSLIDIKNIVEKTDNKADFDIIGLLNPLIKIRKAR